MSRAALETDYLVVGAGATAMAFVDTLLTENPQASAFIVDRHHRPGGHWNDAYPFVRLHQPSEWYGVASSELSHFSKDVAGPNAPLYGLASGAQVLAYFDQVMRERFLPSGRVQWLPMSEVQYEADGSAVVRSLTNGEARPVSYRRRLVDATHAQTAVPSTHAPKYAVVEGVECIPLNRLPDIRRPYKTYTVVGSGKTGMDAVLWLLETGVAAERIRWVMPRDAWLMNRANFQPGIENFERSVGSNVEQMTVVAAADSVADLFARLEARELLLRIDPEVEPTTYRCAVVSLGELAQLRRIKDVVRLGHLRRVERAQIVLDRGVVSADPDTLYVDCSACAIVAPPDIPVFDGKRINLLMVRTCQPLFSAALIAWAESHIADDAEKNHLCGVVPSPERPIDWLRMWLQNLVNGGRWGQRADLMAWQMKCRLNAIAVYARDLKPEDEERLALLKSFGAKAGPAATKLKALLADVAA